MLVTFASKLRMSKILHDTSLNSTKANYHTIYIYSCDTNQAM